MQLFNFRKNKNEMPLLNEDIMEDVFYLSLFEEVRDKDLMNSSFWRDFGNATQMEIVHFFDTNMSDLQLKDLTEVGNTLEQLISCLEEKDKGLGKNITYKVFCLERKLRDYYYPLLLEKMREIEDLIEWIQIICHDILCYLEVGKRMLKDFESTFSSSAIPLTNENELQQFKEKILSLNYSWQFANQQQLQLRQYSNTYQNYFKEVQTMLCNTIPAWRNKDLMVRGLDEVEEKNRALCRMETDASKLENRPEMQELFLENMKGLLHKNLEQLQQIRNNESVLQKYDTISNNDEEEKKQKRIVF